MKKYTTINLLRKTYCSSRNSRLMIILMSIVILNGCNDFVNIAPPESQITTQNVFNNDITATAAMTDVYGRMFSSSSFTFYLTYYNGLSADELITYNSDDMQYQSNVIDPLNAMNYSLWSELYTYVYSANAILQGITTSTAMSTAVKNQLQGEAKFIRAFCNFYLTNLWGDIPVVLTTDYTITAASSRQPAQAVYLQIKSDLQDAKQLLADDYSFSGGERSRPNKWTASALLSRVYLYLKDYPNAVSEASAIISNTNFYSLVSLDSTFLLDNQEAIWQLKSTFQNGGANTDDGEFFILNSVPSLTSLSDDLYNSFETDDQRKTVWTDTTTQDGMLYKFAYKYKIQAGGGTPPITEALTLFRLGEQFLIRAEAEAMNNDLSGAMTDLNLIRSRAQLPAITNSDPNSIMTQLLNERRHELFVECGHRWLDLKRLNLADAVLGPKKVSWKSTSTLFPIPEKEIEKDPFLKPQNPGY